MSWLKKSCIFEGLIFSCSMQQSFSGTHRKTPTKVDGGASYEPVIVAEAEGEAPRIRRTLGFTRPHIPSGSFQQRRHVMGPYYLVIQGFKLLPCRHTPTAAGNGKIFNPAFRLVPICTPIRPGNPFKVCAGVPHHTVAILNKPTIPANLFGT